MERIQIAIIEDEEAHSEFLSSCINRLFGEAGIPFSIDSYLSADSFPLDVTYSLVFIDILINEKNGFELSKRIRAKYDEATTMIIFVTSLLNYAVEGYTVGASGYIVKPYVYEDFTLKITPVLNRLRSLLDETIMVYTRDKQRVPLALSCIYCITSSGHYATYHTEKGDYEVRQNLKDCLDLLQEKGFYQINGYCIASLANIASVKGGDVEIDGRLYNLSRSRKKGFLLEFAKRYGI